jgi:hypothetical protein
VAKIITLQKPGKPDYTKLKAFRPISLLPTISKGFKAVITVRLSYIAKEHSLLLKNHFGARPKRSAEQALNVLIVIVRPVLTMVVGSVARTEG